MSGCEEVGLMLLASARGEPISAPGGRFLREHVEDCASCRQRLANERALTTALAAIASTAADVPAPAIRSALLAEFRKRQTATPIRRTVAKWVTLSAIAAAIFAAFLLTRPDPQRTPVAKPVRVPVAVARPVVQSPAPKDPETRPKNASRQMRRVPARKTPVVQAQEPSEVATEFFQIPYAEPLRPEERADVFRIQVPRASMAVFGLPVAGGRLDSRINADVLMGEDGVARAIRFVR